MSVGNYLKQDNEMRDVIAWAYEDNPPAFFKLINDYIVAEYIKLGIKEGTSFELENKRDSIKQKYLKENVK